MFCADILAFFWWYFAKRRIRKRGRWKATVRLRLWVGRPGHSEAGRRFWAAGTGGWAGERASGGRRRQRRGSQPVVVQSSQGLNRNGTALVTWRSTGRRSEGWTDGRQRTVGRWHQLKQSKAVTSQSSRGRKTFFGSRAERRLKDKVVTELK